MACALAATMLALVVIWRQFSKPAVNLRPSVALGEVLAEETVRLLGANGNTVVIGTTSANDSQTAAGEQLSSFRAAFKRKPSFRLIATELLARPPGLTMNAGDLTSEQLVRLMEKYPAADAFVVFAELPRLSPSLTVKLVGRTLKLLAVRG